MTEPGASTADAIRRAASGDAEALDEIAAAHRSRVLRTAIHLTGDPDLAEDVTQDVFVRLQNALLGFRGDADLSTWLYRVTLNLCRDHARRRSRRAEVGLDQINPVDNDTTNPERALALDRLRDALRQALANLPDEQREVVTLRFISDLPYAEIARLTGLPEGTVASRVFRGLRRLGETVESRHLEIIK
ncbi:MAG: sigma-70 family RNA polymerase sigma factor [Gemmatimonadota bacterium]